MPVSPAPTTTTVAAAGVGGPSASPSQVLLQCDGAVVGVDVKTELRQARHGGYEHPAARRQHQSVVAVRARRPTW